jgi:hypothetical protein
MFNEADVDGGSCEQPTCQHDDEFRSFAGTGEFRIAGCCAACKPAGAGEEKAYGQTRGRVTFTAFSSRSGFSTLRRFPSIFETAVHCRLQQSHI